MISFLDKITSDKVIKFLIYSVYAAGFIGMSVFAFKVGDIHIFPYRVLIPLVWLILTYRVIRNRGFLDIQPIKVKTFGLFLLVWLIYSILSINWAIDKASAFKHVVFLFLSFSVIFFTVVFFDSIDDLRTVSVIWLVFLGIDTTSLAFMKQFLEIISRFQLSIRQNWRILNTRQRQYFITQMTLPLSYL